MNRRGLSPIIATVVLVAFAVALGALIMQVSIDFAGPCAKVEIQLESQAGSPGYCTSGDTVQLNVRNRGTLPIERLIFRSSTDVEGAGIGSGEIVSRLVPFRNLGSSRVEIVPEIIVEEKSLICEDRAIVRDVLPPCT